MAVLAQMGPAGMKKNIRVQIYILGYFFGGLVNLHI